jgi:hypothetical protein
MHQNALVLFQVAQFVGFDLVLFDADICARGQPTSLLIALASVGLAAYAITTSAGNDAGKIIVRLNGFAWSREDFCRGWLITGDTGSGKTRSGINQLPFQVFTNGPKWGGLCIDDKGVYWETLVEMAMHFHREKDLILVQIRPDDPPDDWKPAHTFNLISDSSISMLSKSCPTLVWPDSGR